MGFNSGLKGLMNNSPGWKRAQRK